jgi:hypothetical protein
MGFLSGLSAGQQQEQAGSGILRSANPVASLAAISAARAPAYRGGGGRGGGQPRELNPSAIHQRAAEMVIQEKQANTESIRAQTELFRAQKDAAIARSKEESAKAATAATEGEYKAGMGRAKDWQGATDRQEQAWKDTQAEQKNVQREDYKKSMAGLFQGSGEAMKNYINRYGDPNTNVDSIEFEPNGSGEILVTPSARKDGKKQKAMAFKDLEQFSTAYAFFLHPDSAGILTQAKTPQKTLTIKEAADIRLKGEEEAAKKIGLIPGIKPTPEEEKAIKSGGQEAVDNAIATAGAVGVEAGGIMKGKGLPHQVAEPVPKTLTDKATGRTMTTYPNGSVDVFDKTGKWIGGKDAQGQPTTGPQARDNQVGGSTPPEQVGGADTYTDMYGNNRAPLNREILNEHMKKSREGAIQKPTPSNMSASDAELHRQGKSPFQEGGFKEAQPTTPAQASVKNFNKQGGWVGAMKDVKTNPPESQNFEDWVGWIKKTNPNVTPEDLSARINEIWAQKEEEDAQTVNPTEDYSNSNSDYEAGGGWGD